MNFALRRLVALAAILACAACSAKEYGAPLITGRVVDAESGEPVAEAVVVAEWLVEGGMEGMSTVGVIKVLETHTGSDGAFSLPGWGPVPASSSGAKSGRVRRAAPRLIVFKPGYRFQALKNEDDPPSSARMKSDWSGKEIKLQKPRGAQAEYEMHLSGLSQLIENDLAALWLCKPGERCEAACAWQNIPALLQMLSAQYAQFNAIGIDRSSIARVLVRSASAYEDKGCPSPAAVVGEGAR